MCSYSSILAIYLNSLVKLKYTLYTARSFRKPANFSLSAPLRVRFSVPLARPTIVAGRLRRAWRRNAIGARRSMRLGRTRARARLCGCAPTHTHVRARTAIRRNVAASRQRERETGPRDGSQSSSRRVASRWSCRPRARRVSRLVCVSRPFR